VAGLRALPKRLAFWSMANEKQLEDRIEADPSVLGEPVIILGRQVPTAGIINLACGRSTACFSREPQGRRAGRRWGERFW
jgi:hypothetical protein